MENALFENVQNIQQNHKLHDECHGKLEGGINSGWSNPDRGKNSESPFRETHSPHCYFIEMMPLNHVLRKRTGGHKFSKSQEKIDHQIHREDINVFSIR